MKMHLFSLLSAHIFVLPLLLITLLIDNYYFVRIVGGQKDFSLFGASTGSEASSSVIISYELKSTTEIYHFDENEIIKSKFYKTDTRKNSGRKQRPPKLGLNSGCKLNFRKILRDGLTEIYELEVLDCHPIPCNASHYIFVRKQGEIGMVYSNQTRHTKDPHRWSPGLAFIHLLQDHKKLSKEDYDVLFEPLSDSVQQRAFSIKRIGRQHSILNEFNHTVAFQQYVKYYHTNMAEIIKSFDVEEIFSVDAFYFKIMETKIKTTIEAINVENSVIHKSPCLSNKLIEEKNCVEYLQKNYGYKMIVESIENHFDSILKAKDLFETLENSKEKMNCRLGTKRDLINLNDYAKTRAVNSFLKLYPKVELLSQEDVWNCLMEYKDTEIMHGLLTILALSGRLNAYESIKKLASGFDHLAYWDIYLSMLPYSLDVQRPIIQDLLNKTEVSQEPPHLHLVLTTASLLHRYKKLYTAEELKNAINIFTDKFDKCQTDQCYEIWLQTLYNLRTPELVPLIEKHLCTTFKYDFALLKTLKTINPKMWNNEQFSRKLYRIFANLCPSQKDQSSRIMASELILVVTPESDLVDLVFKMINSIDPKTISGREISSYVLSSIRQQAINDQKFKKVAHVLHQKRYFNEFLSFLFYGQSLCANKRIDVLNLLQPFFHFGTEFGRGMLKRSEAEIGVSVKDEMTVSTLAGLELYSTGQSTIVNLLSSSSSADESTSSTDQGNDNVVQQLLSSDDQDSADEWPLTAGLTLTFFDHSAPPIVFFQGETDLMGAVWSANGDNHVIFNSTFLLNDFRLRLPVASGFLFRLDLSSALSLKIDGSVEISIWYRNLKGAITSRTSFGSVGHLSIQSQEQVLSSHNLKFSSDLGSSLLADVDFYQTPAKFCFQLDQEPATYRFNLKQNSKLLNISQWPSIKRQFDGSCLQINPRMSRACTTMYD